MALDPAWVWGTLVAAEGLAARQTVRSCRAPARFRDNSPEVRQAKEDAYSGPVTLALSALTERVIEMRAPGYESEDGTVEPQPVADVLESTELLEEIAGVTDVFERAVDARRCTRRCRHIHIALGSALLPVMLLLPVPFWPHLATGHRSHLLSGTTEHAANTVLGVLILASLTLFALSILAENSLANSVEKHRPDNARIGS